jgi:hypothetical protein
MEKRYQARLAAKQKGGKPVEHPKTLRRADDLVKVGIREFVTQNPEGESE